MSRFPKFVAASLLGCLVLTTAIPPANASPQSPDHESASDHEPGLVLPSLTSGENTAEVVSEIIAETHQTEDITLNEISEHEILIPEDSSEPIVMGLPESDKSIGIDVPSAAQAQLEVLETGDAVVAGQDPHTNVLIQQFDPAEFDYEATGLRVLFTLDQVEADPLFDIGLDLPEGAVLEEQPDGDIHINDANGELLA